MPSYSFIILQGRVILPSDSSANNNKTATPITEDSGHTSAWPKVCSCTLRCWMLELIFSCVAYWCRALITEPGRERWTQEHCACTKVHSSVSNTFIRMYLDRISEEIFFTATAKVSFFQAIWGLSSRRVASQKQKRSCCPHHDNRGRLKRI
jgi:hypothetical protein